MVFYVPLGVRGVLFLIGTALIGVLGGWVYWRASRRRAILLATIPGAELIADVPVAI